MGSFVLFFSFFHLVAKGYGPQINLHTTWDIRASREAKSVKLHLRHGEFVKALNGVEFIRSFDSKSNVVGDIVVLFVIPARYLGVGTNQWVAERRNGIFSCVHCYIHFNLKVYLLYKQHSRVAEHGN